MNSHLNNSQFIKIIFVCFGLLVSKPSLAIDSSLLSYQWERGLTFMSANLTLGGYSGVSFKLNESGTGTVTLDDISLFISWSPYARIRFFSEIEMENLVSNRAIASFSESLSIERLYVDFLISDRLTLRLGQFLTPVGRWNTIHVWPLTWTTVRPIVTKYHFFPSQSNGIMLMQQWIINQQNLKVSFYLDDSEHLNPRQINHHKMDPDAVFKQAAGVSINYEINHELALGFSYLAFKKQVETQQAINHLVGLDLLWQKKGYEIQTEWAYRQADDQQGEEIAGYIQGVVPLGHKFFAVGRYELLSGRHQRFSINFNGTAHVGVSALVWRPFSPLSLKVEYHFGHNNQQLAPSGFFSSISVLF
ncbi:MAG: hypothetical protein Q9M50_11770 [Methylococcales bacterium]|nr:hypothetical protein [Methylococcales bacterium]